MVANRDYGPPFGQDRRSCDSTLSLKLASFFGGKCQRRSQLCQPWCNKWEKVNAGPDENNSVPMFPLTGIFGCGKSCTPIFPYIGSSVRSSHSILAIQPSSIWLVAYSPSDGAWVKPWYGLPARRPESIRRSSHVLVPTSGPTCSR